MSGSRTFRLYVNSMLRCLCPVIDGDVQWCNLQVLSASHNQLVTLPPELRHCSSLRELHLESNRITTPVLDLRHLKQLQQLQVRCCNHSL